MRGLPHRGVQDAVLVNPGREKVARSVREGDPELLAVEDEVLVRDERLEEAVRRLQCR